MATRIEKLENGTQKTKADAHKLEKIYEKGNKNLEERANALQKANEDLLSRMHDGAKRLKTAEEMRMYIQSQIRVLGVVLTEHMITTEDRKEREEDIVANLEDLGASLCLASAV